MGIDIRLPIGALLACIGLLLSLQGLVGDPSIYAKSLGINVNLWWGLVLLVVGAGFLVAVTRARRRARK
jgi:hypothetical protein